MGRKALGKQARSSVLQIRLTDEQHGKVMALGGSAWARELIEEKIAEQDDATERQSSRRSKRGRDGESSR